MGDPKRGDWGPTRDPKRNAQIAAVTAADRRAQDAYLKHLKAFRERRYEKLPSAAEHLNLLIPILLGEWQHQVDNAITDVPYPSEKESQVYWYVALAGNLVWAATCFLDPAVAAEATLIKVLNFSGAIYASGSLKKAAAGEKTMPPAPTDPNDAKQLLRKQVALARGALETYFQEKRSDWASGFSRLQDWNKADDTVLSSFDAYIWEKMFPWIPYNDDRFDRIRVQAIEMVRNAMADYLHQWREFQQSNVWAGAAELKRLNIVFRPYLRISFGGKLLGEPPPSSSLKIR